MVRLLSLLATREVARMMMLCCRDVVVVVVVLSLSFVVAVGLLSLGW